MIRRLLFLVPVFALLSCSDVNGPETPSASDDAAVGVSSHATGGASGNTAAPAGLSSTATLTFGRTGVGSPFPPPSGHDMSMHAYDKILPHVANITVGGSVDVTLGPLHGVAIYDVGTRPQNLTLTDATLDDLAVPFPPGVLPNFVINDPNNRVAVGPAINPVAPQTWSSPAGTFDAPGRYLVICTILPHFALAKMYAYVNVH